MPITHATIPIPPAQVGQAEWAEEHTLPTATEIGALTPSSADAIYARQVSAVTTAQLDVYLLSQDASTTYARQASAVTTAQLGPYLTSASASTIYARQTSAVTTAQLAVYLLSNDASTTYARQTSAVTTAQLAPYLTSASAAAIYLTSAGGGFTEASADAKYIVGRAQYVTADVTNATTVVTTINDLIFSCSASTLYQLDASLVWRSSATTTGIGILCSVTPTPGIYAFQADIYGFGVDGAAGVYCGYASANADIILGTSAHAAAIDIPLVCRGTVITGATNPSYVQLAFRSEVSGSDVKIRRGSHAILRKIGNV